MGRKGWTVVELLIVLTIIGILAAIVFGGVRGWDSSSCKDYCKERGATIWTHGAEGCTCGGSTGP